MLQLNELVNCASGRRFVFVSQGFSCGRKAILFMCDFDMIAFNLSTSASRNRFSLINCC